MNENCLKGIRCPKCEQEDSFRIEGKTLFLMTDDGTDEFGDVDYDDGSTAYCTDSGCAYFGPLAVFRIENQKKMKKGAFVVLRPEIHKQRVLVFAKNKDEAIKKVVGGDGIVMEPADYTETLEPHEREWQVLEAPV